jgi:hypothetical protein
MRTENNEKNIILCNKMISDVKNGEVIALEKYEDDIENSSIFFEALNYVIKFFPDDVVLLNSDNVPYVLIPMSNIVDLDLSPVQLEIPIPFLSIGGLNVFAEAHGFTYKIFLKNERVLQHQSEDPSSIINLEKLRKKLGRYDFTLEEEFNIEDIWNLKDIIKYLKDTVKYYNLECRKTEFSQGIASYVYTDGKMNFYFFDNFENGKKSFQFGILSDDGNEVKSLEFEDYTDREKFISRFNDFKKFFTEGGSNEEK